MGKQIKVEVIIGAKRIPKTYEEGVTYEQVAKEVQSAYSYPIILARRGGKLVELNKRIREDVQICFMTTADDSGHKTYVRGVTLLMLRAFYAVCKGQPLENVYVKYQIGDSCYCEVSGVPVTESLLQQVEQYMKELVHRDIPFLKRSVDTSEALRIFEKYAVRVGGGYNHRYNLSDGVLLKDNHIGAAGSVAKAVEMAKEYAPFVRKIEVEVENLDMVREAVDAGADIIMLDNMSPEDMKEAIRIIDGRAETECSGNVTKENIDRLTSLGVDYISSGALTHSAPVLDISLKNLHAI